MQQEVLIRRRGLNKSPQEMCIIDLRDFISKKMRDGHEILLCIDANEKWDKPGSRIKEMATKLGLIDLAKEKHNSKVPPTYVRRNSANRIDYLLGSKLVADNTVAMGIKIKSGVTQFGDHTPQFIDININNLLQLNMMDMETPRSQRLCSNDPKRVEQYVQEVSKSFDNHRIEERVNALWNNITRAKAISEEMTKEYEKIDRDVYRLCFRAENKIKMHKYSHYVWSPNLDQAKKDCNFWEAWDKHKGEGIKGTTWKNLGIREGYITHKQKITTCVVKEERERAAEKLKEVQSKDKEYRIQYLNRLADKYAADNNVSQATAIKELFSHEEIRDMFRTIRRKLKITNTSQLTEVWIKDAQDRKMILEESQAVEDHLLQRNWKNLRQAAATPFAEGALGDGVENDGSGDLADRIVEGEYLPEIENSEDIVQEYIRGMSARDKSIINSVRVNITMEEYRRFWKTKRESTATSPYGLHIGHYRSCLDREDLLEVHRKLLMIPFQYGMVPDRWSTTVQILLEKDSSSPWSNRLRIIKLFDSQLNCGLQIIFGKRMVRNALKNGLIHNSAYGSVPNRTAQDAVMEKEISYDMMRLTKSCGAIFDCDAKGCYDRIIAPMQSISSRRWGVPKVTVTFFAKLWKKCRHFIRTKHGMSKESYNSTREKPLFGIGQGNGAGPAFCLSNLTVMLEVLYKASSGIKLCNPSNTVWHKSIGMGFVDDVTLGCSTKVSYVNEEVVEATSRVEQGVIEEITKMSQDWECMLHTNGGLLELRKCYWILISWKWLNGVARMKKMEEVEAQLDLRTTKTGTRSTITRKSVDAAPRIMGCHVAADGNWKGEVGKWTSEAYRFANRVKRSKLDLSSGPLVYNTMWLSRLRYISSPVCFTQKQSKAIDKPVIAACLAASGLNIRFPRKVVHGPSELGGLDWENSMSLQITQKVKFFIRHVRQDSKIGKMLRILIENIQLVAGLHTPVLETDIRWTTWVERTWAHSLKEGLDTMQGKIKTNFRIQKVPRNYDRSIMEVFSTWDLNTKIMAALNKCRLFLRAIYISDITNFEGTKIIQEALNVEKTRESTLNWPVQQRPSKQDRKVWFKHISKLCYDRDQLITSLGRWMSKPHQKWRYMCARNGLFLLRNSNTGQTKHRQVRRGYFENWGQPTLGYESGIPIEVGVTPTGFAVQGDSVDIWERRLERGIYQNMDNATKRRWFI